jgi:hypothetical protein
MLTKEGGCNSCPPNHKCECILSIDKAEICGNCGNRAGFVSVAFHTPVCGIECENALWEQYEEDLSICYREEEDHVQHFGHTNGLP